MTIHNTPIRFFHGSVDGLGDTDVVEIDHHEFERLIDEPYSAISYQRHTIFDNGVEQICLTVIAV